MPVCQLLFLRIILLPLIFRIAMSTKAQVVMEQIRTLPRSDQLELLRELEQAVGQPSTGPVELYGGPLTDEDIEQAAHVAFQTLDDEEKRAGSR